MHAFHAHVLAIAAISATAAADDLDGALALVPAGVDAAIVIPHLKKASDDLQSCLERADRAETTLIGRPLDLVKGRLGVDVGVRDDGALVAFMRSPAAGGEPVPTVLVPVTDEAAFLSNFEPGATSGVQTVRRPDGMTLFVAGVPAADPEWIALSPTQGGVQGLDIDPSRGPALRASLGAGAEQLLRGQDVVVWTTGESLNRQRERAADPEALAEAGLDEADRAEAIAWSQRAQALFGRVDVAAMSWDIDALGLIGRGLVTTKDAPDGTPRLLDGGPRTTPRAAGARLGLLPAQPCYSALGIDVSGVGGRDALRALAALLPGLEELASPDSAIDLWLDHARELQVAIYPSKLGVSVGGVLNDAALVLRAPSPAEARDAIRGRLEALTGEEGGVRRTLTWEADRAVKDSGAADAFELTQTRLPGAPEQEGADAMRGVLASFVLGARGLHGFMKPFTQEGLLVATFSQRPDVWRRAAAAATSADGGLGAEPTIAAMRGFALPDPDVEMIIGVTELLKLARQIARTFPGAGDLVPAIEAGREPIYVAAEVGDGRAETACIIPSAIVGLMVDQARANVLGAAPADQPAKDGAQR